MVRRKQPNSPVECVVFSRLSHQVLVSAGASIQQSAPSCTAITGGCWNSTQQQNAYIIKWTHVSDEIAKPANKR